MVCLFYFRLTQKFRWGGCRYFFLFIGAGSFYYTFTRWQRIYRGDEDIPYGSMINGEEDAGGDMNGLHAEFGWTQHDIRFTYHHLGNACLAVMIGFYLFFALRLDKVVARLIKDRDDSPSRPGFKGDLPAGTQAGSESRPTSNPAVTFSVIPPREHHERAADAEHEDAGLDRGGLEHSPREGKRPGLNQRQRHQHAIHHEPHKKPVADRDEHRIFPQERETGVEEEKQNRPARRDYIVEENPNVAVAQPPL